MGLYFFRIQDSEQMYALMEKVIRKLLSISFLSLLNALEHIVTLRIHLIPNILHFVAYAMGLYFFRIQNSKQMYAWIEKELLLSISFFLF